MTMAQDGGKVVSLTHRPPLPPGNTHGTLQTSWLHRASNDVEHFYLPTDTHNADKRRVIKTF